MLSSTYLYILCRKYLSDPTEDVRVATEILLADFLREIREVSNVRKKREEQAIIKKDKELSEPIRRLDPDKEKLPDITLSHPERAAFLQEDDAALSDTEGEQGVKDEIRSYAEHRDNGGESGTIIYF